MFVECNSGGYVVDKRMQMMKRAWGTGAKRKLVLRASTDSPSILIEMLQKSGEKAIESSKVQQN